MMPENSETKLIEAELIGPDQKCVEPSKKALVADDDPGILAMMRQILEKDGWKVLTSDNMWNAMSQLDDSVNVAFIDVHMPGQNTLGWLEMLHSRSPRTRLVTITGDREAFIGTEAFRRGASDFLRKPIEISEVLASANAAFGEMDRARENVEDFFGLGATKALGNS